jgi:hypothetical protein
MARTRRDASPVPVRITLRDHSAEIRPYVPALEPAITCAHKCLTKTDGVWGAETTTERFAAESLLGGRSVPPGLVDRCRRALEDAGHEVTVNDRRGPLPSLASEALTGGEPDRGEEWFLGVVERERRACVATTGPADQLRLLALLAGRHPAARIAVVAPTQRDARALRRALAGAINEAVGIAHSGRRWRVTARVVVCTPAYVEFVCRGCVLGQSASCECACRGCACCVRRRDVFALADADRLLGHEAVRRVSKAASDWHVPRLDAFVPAGRLPAPPDVMRLEALAGPVLHRHAPAAPPAQVVLVRSDLPRVRSGDGVRAWKRATYWENRPRNRLAARLAHALVSGDAAALERLGAAGLPAGLITGYLRVALLVESAAHFRELRGLLPGWPLLEVGTAEPGVWGGVVVTVTRAAQGDLRPNVVVRVDGGTGMAGVRGLAGRGKNPLWVVDFTDDFDPCAANDSLKRVAAYREAGYPVLSQTTG